MTKGKRDPAIMELLQDVYVAFNVAGRLRRDPLALVACYADPADREVAGMVCSTLAFGGVDLILRACREALEPLGPRPAQTLAAMREADIAGTWAGFQYRFCFAKDMIALLVAVKRARERSGTLERFFMAGDPGGPDVAAATTAFARGLKALGPGLRENLLPDPERGSACKRLFLYLRWMVRQDEVDPGGWNGVDRSRLIIPLDLHMVRVCRERLGFISSPYATLRNALAATAGFRLYSPEDPVKFDFSLTRPGIDPDPGDERFLPGKV
jgi:uncharacterized protein (TIGR02757 family)